MKQRECLFCDTSFNETELMIQERGAICSECLDLVKEIINEFREETFVEKKVVCSFCGKGWGGGVRVFQGKRVGICSDCVEGLSAQPKGQKMSIQGAAQEELTEEEEETSIASVLRSRLKKEVFGLSAYSVPKFPSQVKLDGNESPFSLPDEVMEEIAEEIKKIPVNRYPDPEGEALRKKIAAKVGLPTENILLGNGSDELIGVLITAFSGGTGRVLYPVPTFSMYRILALSHGVEVVEVGLDERFDIDLKATLREVERKNPDLIFFASPNNPTGNRFSDSKILKVLKGSSSIVVVDEAYCDFAGKTLLPLMDSYERLIILRSMSKIGFAAIRLGALFGREKIVRELNKVRLPYNVNSMTQLVGGIILDRRGLVEERVRLIVAERERVYKGLSLMSWVEPFPSDANFILFRVGDAEKIFKALVERGVLIRNFHSPGRLENCLRVTIGTPEENEAFLTALGEILSSP